MPFLVRTIPSVSEFHRLGEEIFLRRLYCRWGIAPRPKVVFYIITFPYLIVKRFVFDFFRDKRKIDVEGTTLSLFTNYTEHKTMFFKHRFNNGKP